MRITLVALTTVIAFLLFVTARGGAQTTLDLPIAEDGTNRPIVAELFTSQSCSSCPPAEKLFSELSERDDLIVLEWHVDYWDRLVHGRAGAWKDPYSNADYSARQRLYNRTLRKTGRVYTPQAVINGVTETVGSRRNDVSRLLTTPSHATADIVVEPSSDLLRVEINDYKSDLNRTADIYRLTLLPTQTTDVPRGENRGSTLTSRNIVLSFEKVGTYSGDAISLEIKTPENGETCAIIIQQKRASYLGPILGASYCS